MNAETIKIECEDDGFHIVIDSPQWSDELHFRIDDPEELYDAVKATIGPWLYEKYQAKAEFDRAKRQNDTRLLTDEEFSAYVDDAYGDDWSKRVGMEQMREQGCA